MFSNMHPLPSQRKAQFPNLLWVGHKTAAASGPASAAALGPWSVLACLFCLGLLSPPLTQLTATCSPSSWFSSSSSWTELTWFRGRLLFQSESQCLCAFMHSLVSYLKVLFASNASVTACVFASAGSFLRKV